MEISEELQLGLFKKYGKEFKKGEILFEQGDIAEEMYIIIDGKVDIFITIGEGENKRNKVLATLKAGDFLGEMSILNNEPRSASASISEDAKILIIDQETFAAMIRNNAEFSLKILSRLSDRLRTNNQQLQSLMAKNKKLQIIQTLIKISKEQNKEVLQKDEALAVIQEKENIEPEEASEILKKMETVNVISSSNGDIKIVNIKELERLRELLEV